MGMSLYQLMRINRGRFFNLPHINPPNNPDNYNSPPINPDNHNNPTSSGYTLSDFGRNAINNHSAGAGWHSSKNQEIFNYVTRNYRDRCTSYESYLTPILGNSIVTDELNACKLVKADIIYTPYVNAAYWTNTPNDNLILTVGSHCDNDGQNDIHVGSDNNRHDITPNATTFLSDSVACSARRDTPEKFKDSTSEGFGMEFFEDCSPEGLDDQFPDKDVPSAFAELLSEDGITLTSTVHPIFTSYLKIGDEITIRRTSDESTWETITITNIIDNNHITVFPAITPIITPSIYGWHNVTLGSFLYGQAESWAVPLIAGKLKVIQLEVEAQTGIKPTWDEVREASRATARRNPTGIPEIDNTNWDIYRGFGQIRVNSAINYILNNRQQ